MPRKKARVEEKAEQVPGAPQPAAQQQGQQGAGEQSQQQQQQDANSRRDGMASIARKRAAHFAHFVDEDEDAGQDNVHVGSNQARTLGPWSSAVELVNAREAAKEKRLQAGAGAGAGAAEQGEGDGGADPAAAAWSPRRDPALGPHPADPVPPLFDLCLGTLTAFVDCVESLWGVPDTIRTRLAASVCAQRRMTPEVAQMFASDAPSELVLPDCTQLDAAALGGLLREAVTPRLQRLELGFCGRGFGDEAAAVVAGAGLLPGLESLALRGAYRLTDAGLIKTLSAAPALTSLAVPEGPRLTGELLAALPGLVPGLRQLDLSDCRGLGAEALCAALPRLTALEALRLDLIPEVDDAVVTAAASLPALRELSLRRCAGVGDGGLTALAATRGSALTALRLDEAGPRLSDAGLGALASQCTALRVFSARRCARLSDGALAALARSAPLAHLALSGCGGAGPALAAALAGCCHGSLEVLDLSFCRRLPDRSLGLLLDRCSRLRRLTLYGCSQLSTASLYGHTNAGLVLEGLHTQAVRHGGAAAAQAQAQQCGVAAAAAGGKVLASEAGGKGAAVAAGAEQEGGEGAEVEYF